MEDFTQVVPTNGSCREYVSDLSGAAAEVSSSVLAPSTGAARSRLKELWVTPLQSLLMFVPLGRTGKHI